MNTKYTLNEAGNIPKQYEPLTPEQLKSAIETIADIVSRSLRTEDDVSKEINNCTKLYIETLSEENQMNLRRANGSHALSNSEWDQISEKIRSIIERDSEPLLKKCGFYCPGGDARPSLLGKFEDNEIVREAAQSLNIPKEKINFFQRGSFYLYADGALFYRTSQPVQIFEPRQVSPNKSDQWCVVPYNGESQFDILLDEKAFFEKNKENTKPESIVDQNLLEMRLSKYERALLEPEDKTEKLSFSSVAFESACGFLCGSEYHRVLPGDRLILIQSEKKSYDDFFKEHIVHKNNFSQIFSQFKFEEAFRQHPKPSPQTKVLKP